MQKKYKALGLGLGLMALLAIMPAKGVTTIVNEDFETGAPGTVPSGWTALGGTENFAPGIDDTRSVLYGNYDGGQTMALTNPELEFEGMVGAIVYNTPVNILSNKLLVEFDLLMSPGTSETPADGCALMVLPTMPTAAGSTGGGMGWSGLGGFAVEFDIYDNGDADPDDLVGQTEFQIMMGEAVAGNTLGNPAARQVGVDVAWHGVSGDAVNSTLLHDAEGNLAVYPNVPDFLATRELPATIHVHVWFEYDNGYVKVDMMSEDPLGVYPEYEFPRDTVIEGAIGPWWFHGGDEEAYVGFSGAIGGSNALQEVDNLVISVDPNLGEESFNEELEVVEIDPAGKVAEAGVTAEIGWNVDLVKLNEESGQVFATFDIAQRIYKTHWVLDNTPPTASETPLVVNYASTEYAADAPPLFQNESPFPGIEYVEAVWANTEEDPVPEEVKIDNFAVRATGFIEFPEPGMYFLGLTHDDNFTMFIGGERLFQDLDTGNPDIYKVFVPEAGVYPIQVDHAEQGWYAHLAIFEADAAGKPLGLINDGSRVTVYLAVDGAEIPPTNYDALNIVTADPAEKVGQVGEGTNPGFNYDYRSVRNDEEFFLDYLDLNNHIDAAMVLTPGVPADTFLLTETGVVDVVNYRGTDDAGNQPGGTEFPGLDNDDSVMVVTGFAEFTEPGLYAMFVNSDDGFEAGIGSQQIITAGNKGASDVPVFVNITEPGLYPLQVNWYERNSGNSFELTQWIPTGATLVNSAESTVKVYTDAPGADSAAFLPSAYQLERVSGVGSCVDSGFNVRFVKNFSGVGNLDQAKQLLAGDWEIDYEDVSIQSVIDFFSTGGQGNFESGVPFPTLAVDVDDNDFAIEATGFIELSEGWHQFGVNSDDGFGLYIGGFRVREYFDGKGVSDVNGSIYIPEAGLYPILLQYWEGGGGAACELYYLREDGSKVLVNDTANGGPAVCLNYEPTGETEAPVITSITADGTNIVVSWTGGTAPFQVQVTDTLGGAWADAGAPTSDSTATIPADAAAGFIRVVPAN